MGDFKIPRLPVSCPSEPFHHFLPVNVAPARVLVVVILALVVVKMRNQQSVTEFHHLIKVLVEVGVPRVVALPV